jgi:xanthine dehydrogenase accessory factor
MIITELPQPLVVRRSVAFAEAVYRGEMEVEGVRARRAASAAEAFELVENGLIPILVDPQADLLASGRFAALVDARLTKLSPDPELESAPLTIGLGPGFVAGTHVHAVIETQRGHRLGRVYWSGSAISDSGQPEGDPRRVLRAPAAGTVETFAEIGDQVRAGEVIAQIGGIPLEAPLPGVLRGLIHSGLAVTKGLKIGDIDPRDDPALCFLVSDKALAVGGGVLEALLSRPAIRRALWDCENPEKLGMV